jgi:hypothetical protein
MSPYIPTFVLLLAATARAGVPGVHVDQATSAWHDGQNRSLVFRGINFVQKGSPYYPTITASDFDGMEAMGTNVVRLGVMMYGLFPEGPTASAAYLKTIGGIIDSLWAKGIMTIIDLHQDVLAPKLCGEGTPDWMLNVSTLNAMPFPEPVVLHGVPADPATGTYPNKSCAATGLLKFIGWSEFYMTDACGKAFQQIYDGTPNAAAPPPGTPPLSYIFDAYWRVVSSHFKGHPGVLAYEVRVGKGGSGGVLWCPVL